jgi:hypothetical protein
VSTKKLWVKYSVVDGAHFFTGSTAETLGLCVAHHDLKTAFDEAQNQLKNLLLFNHGINAEIEPPPFEELEALAKNAKSPKIQTTTKLALKLVSEL